ncbi:MAG: MFS transporter [Clostridia bacterium]|nr:MFS transporter [Clostridia bacterium]
MEKRSFGKINWLILFLFGSIGQIAWSVENMYFNLFLFETVAPSLEAVTLMVQLSGITATVITLIAGTLSDKLKNRRTFISLGYLIWGITVFVFAFISTKNTQSIFNIKELERAVAVTLAIIVIMDCVMTAFGSTANDACFNAWVTDNSHQSYRGKLESILSVFPLLAMLIVAGGFGMLVSLIGYSNLFMGMGIVIMLIGVLGFLTIKDNPSLQNTEPSKFSDIIYGFRPSVIKKNVKLYLVLLIVGVYGIACQIFMPYIIIFMKEYLLFSTIEYSLVFGVAILFGSAIAVYLGILSDKWQKGKALYLGVAILAVGLLGMYLSSGLEKPILFVIFGLFGLIMIVGNVLILTLTGALIRDNTPESNVGKLQGIRMIFSVLIPMLVGPMIGNAINAAKNIPIPDAGSADAMTTAYIPAPEIFLAASLCALIAIIFIVILNKKVESDNRNAKN